MTQLKHFIENFDWIKSANLIDTSFRELSFCISIASNRYYCYNNSNNNNLYSLHEISIKVFFHYTTIRCYTVTICNIL